MTNLTRLKERYYSEMCKVLKERLSVNFQNIQVVERIDYPTKGLVWAASGGIEWEGKPIYLSVWVNPHTGYREFRIETLGTFAVNPVDGLGDLKDVEKSINSVLSIVLWAIQNGAKVPRYFTSTILNLWSYSNYLLSL